MQNFLPIFVDVSIGEIGLGPAEFEWIINIHPNWVRAIDRLLADLETEGVADPESEPDDTGDRFDGLS